MAEPRYNKACRNEDCLMARREDDVLCRRCYMRLPRDLQLGLWLKEGESVSVWHGRVVFALNWLDENGKP